MKVISIRTSILTITLILFATNLLNCENVTNNSKTRDEIKILTWNIYMLPHISWLKGNSKRAAGIAEKLNSSDYDIIVFQEAFDYHARRKLRKQLSGSYPFMYGPANQSRFSMRTSSGIWVVSKIPLNKIEEIEYSCKYGIDAMARKGAVMFQGDWKGKEFQLVGTHLQSDSPDEVRHKQCKEIYQNLLKKYYHNNIPQIVCGDFNIEMADSVNYNLMLKTLNAENGVLDGNINVSFDEIDNQLAKRSNGRKQLIDYILVCNSHLIQNIHRRISVFHGYDNNVITDLSDHYAIEATISFGATLFTAAQNL